MASSLALVGGSKSLKINLLDKNLLGGASSSADRSARPCSCSMTILTKPRRGKTVNSSTRIVARKSVEAVVQGKNRRHGDETAAAAACEKKLDEWMRDSVTEIVQNLREAPLLVHVYGEDEARRMRLETEKRAEEENWDALKSRWDAEVSPSPEGVIFVEELTDDDGDGEVDGGVEDNVNGGDGMTKAWGLVVQGRGEECGGPACYLLKTSRVNVGSGYGLGLGMGCTHFCLVRVKSFRETAKSQLKNSWLLQAQLQGGQGR